MVEHSCNLKDSICFRVYTLILVRYSYSKGLSPEKKMWYFSVKQRMQLLEPGEYGSALSRILHSSDISLFLLFWSHMKLDNSVAFRLFSFLKDFLCLYSLSLKKLSVNHLSLRGQENLSLQLPEDFDDFDSSLLKTFLL